MIRAIIWKEVREQGLIGLTLVVLGSGVLATAAILADPPASGVPPSDVVRFLGVGLMATLMLAVTAGTVCGGAVFAAEREAATLGYLESLPASRTRLWVAKLVAGFGLAVVQAGALVGVAAALGLIQTPGWAVAVGVFSLLAFAWGVFGSTLARTTLGSVGIAIPTAVLAAVLVLIPLLLLFPTRRSTFGGLQATGALLFLVLMFVIPLMLSAWIYTAPDRNRARAASETGPLPADGSAPRRSRAQFGFVALLWMTLRQLRGPALALSAFALAAGLSLTAAGARPALMWPTLALAAGVLAGVLAFADEQTRGSSHFWGEQRLPLGRLWLVKIGAHLLLGAWLILVLALPLMFRAQFDESMQRRNHTYLAIVFRSQLFDVNSGIGLNGWKYLLVPAAYGFAAGHVCGLLFRKLAVACGVAGILGGVGALVWMPSLLAGGVYHWQLWVPPVVILLTARLLLAAWATDRLLARRSLHVLAAGAVATAIVLGAGVGYRVLEVPDQSGGDADVAFVATLPPLDQNLAGRDFRAAADRYVRRVAESLPRPEGVDTSGMVIPPPSPRAGLIEDGFGVVIIRGWNGDKNLADFLDKLFGTQTIPRPGVRLAEVGQDAAFTHAKVRLVLSLVGIAIEPGEDTWYSLTLSASLYPVGIFEYPQSVKYPPARDPVYNSRRMALALLARGIQEQAAGRPGVFVDHLRLVVALARTMRNAAVIDIFATGTEIEQIALGALKTWLDNLDHSPEHLPLLRRVQALLEADDPVDPFDPTPHYLAERYALRESQKTPAQWLPALLTPPGGSPDLVEAEVEFVSVAWAVPWERERTRRLVGLGFESGPPTNYRYISGRPGLGLILRPRLSAELVEIERALRGHRRAAILHLALRAFRTERGKYPEPDQLRELVDGKYLARLPRDPHDEKREFGYRLARPVESIGQDQPKVLPDQPKVLGEHIRPAVQLVPPAIGRPADREFVRVGQPLVWSVGPDLVDNGGVSPQLTRQPTRQPEDLVYPVPRGSGP